MLRPLGYFSMCRTIQIFLLIALVESQVSASPNNLELQILSKIFSSTPLNVILASLATAGIVATTYSLPKKWNCATGSTIMHCDYPQQIVGNTAHIKLQCTHNVSDFQSGVYCLDTKGQPSNAIQTKPNWAPWVFAASATGLILPAASVMISVISGLIDLNI